MGGGGLAANYVAYSEFKTKIKNFLLRRILQMNVLNLCHFLFYLYPPPTQKKRTVTELL